MVRACLCHLAAVLWVVGLRCVHGHSVSSGDAAHHCKCKPTCCLCRVHYGATMAQNRILGAPITGASHPPAPALLQINLVEATELLHNRWK